MNKYKYSSMLLLFVTIQFNASAQIVEYTKSVADWAGVVNGIHETIEIQRNVNDMIDKGVALEEKLNKLNKKYNNYEFTIQLKSKGLLKDNPLDATQKAINTLVTRQIDIKEQVQMVEGKYGALLNQYERLEKLKKVEGAFDNASMAFVLVDVANDLINLKSRVRAGSSMTAELLHSSLKVLETELPSVPGYNLSDISRAMLDLTIELKGRNRSLLDSSAGYHNLVSSLVSGNNSIQQQLVKRLDGVSLDYLDGAYETTRDNHLRNLDQALALINNYKLYLTNEREGVLSPESRDLYDALINGLDVDISYLNSEISEVKKGKGYSLVVDSANSRIAQQLMELAKSSDNFMSKQQEVLTAAAESAKAGNADSAGCVSLMQRQISTITLGGASHIGSASMYMGCNPQERPSENIDPLNPNNQHRQTNIINQGGSGTPGVSPGSGNTTVTPPGSAASF